MTQKINLCLTCQYWGGDKERMKAIINENPLSMDLFKGWPEYGKCNIEYEWHEINMNGDAAIRCEVPANFGCPYWGAESNQ